MKYNYKTSEKIKKKTLVEQIFDSFRMEANNYPLPFKKSNLTSKFFLKN